MKKLLTMLSICMLAILFVAKPAAASPTGVYPDMDYKSPITFADKTLMQNNKTFFEVHQGGKTKLFDIKDCDANAKYYDCITYYDGKIYFVISLKNSNTRKLYSYDVAKGERRLIKTLSGKSMAGFNYGYFADNKFYYNVAASYTKSGKVKTKKIKYIDLTTGKAKVYRTDYALADPGLVITHISLLNVEPYKKSDEYVLWQKESGRYYLYNVKANKGMLLPKASIFQDIEGDKFYAGELVDYKGTIFCAMFEGSREKGKDKTTLYKIDFAKKKTTKLKTAKDLYSISHANSKYVFLVNDSLEELKVKY